MLGSQWNLLIWDVKLDTFLKTALQSSHRCTSPCCSLAKTCNRRTWARRFPIKSVSVINPCQSIFIDIKSSTFLTWCIGTQSTLIRFLTSMDSFLMADQRVLLTKASTALVTLKIQVKKRRKIINDLKLKNTLTNLVRPLARVNSLMPSTQTWFVEFHGAMSTLEPLFSNCFTAFAFFLARQDRVDLIYFMTKN